MSCHPSERNCDRFTITYWLWLKVIAGVGVLFFGGIFVVCLGDILLGWNIFTDVDAPVTVLYGIFTAFYIYGFLGIVVWKVQVNGDELVQTNMLGIKKQYSAREITRIDVWKGEKLVLYSGERKLFSMALNMENVSVFVDPWCTKYGGHVELTATFPEKRKTYR